MTSLTARVRGEINGGWLTSGCVNERQALSQFCWLSKMESGGSRPKFPLSESLRVTLQGLPEDHRHAGLDDWL